MIPRNKITDSRFGKPKAFTEIKHMHEGKPTRLESKRCVRCHYDVAEQSLVDYIKDHDITEKIKGGQVGIQINQLKTHTFSKMIVHRGSLDDCIAWDVIWS